MGSRAVHISIDGFVDKGVAIDLANEGGKAEFGDWETFLYWVGAMVGECVPRIVVTTDSDL